MSRSQPDANQPNPSVRWFEWNGEKGIVRYYDKEKKENIDVPLPFTFILLDELGSVRGWHEPSQSGIISNEVRDTRQDVMVVKSFKGGTLAEGLYKDIKDRVHSVGGKFVANCYIAFKNGDGLDIGSMRFKGGALGAWMDFRKANRQAIYKKAVTIHGSVEGKKGRVVFKMPAFTLKELGEDSNLQAVALDQQLQEFLSGYLNRTKRDQVDSALTLPQERETDTIDPPYRDDIDDAMPTIAPDSDDIPF